MTVTETIMVVGALRRDHQGAEGETIKIWYDTMKCPAELRKFAPIQTPVESIF